MTINQHLWFKHRSSVILSIVLAFVCLGCHTSKPLYTTNASTFLTQQSIGNLDMQAQKGNGDAANKLFNYYYFNTDKRDLAIKWLSIAATNGNASAQYNFGIYYSGNLYPEINDTQSARYWFERALTNGVLQASQRLRELNRK